MPAKNILQSELNTEKRKFDNIGPINFRAENEANETNKKIEKMNKFRPDNFENSVAASDAFFPFVDGFEKLVQAGVSAIIQPYGSIKDKEIIKLQKIQNKLKNHIFIEKAPDHIVADYKKQEIEIKSSIEKFDQIINTIN